MNPKAVIAAVAVIGIGAWFALKDRASSDPAVATQQAAELAVKGLPNFIEEATDKAQRTSRPDNVDWTHVADDAIRSIQSKSGSGRKNPYDASYPVFVAGPVGTRAGTVYLDSSHAAAEGTIWVTAIYLDPSKAIHNDGHSVSMPSWKAKAGIGNTDHMIIQGL